MPAKLSPAMQQYRDFKQQHPGYVLFFRMGDFYEMFWEDARRCTGSVAANCNPGCPPGLETCDRD
jgi:DNA mismatch repair ATPase MutS